jgi:small basic protein
VKAFPWFVYLLLAFLFAMTSVFDSSLFWRIILAVIAVWSGMNCGIELNKANMRARVSHNERLVDALKKIGFI